MDVSGRDGFMLLMSNIFLEGGRVTVWECVGVVGEILRAMWGAGLGCFDSRTLKFAWFVGCMHGRLVDPGARRLSCTHLAPKWDRLAHGYCKFGLGHGWRANGVAS